MLHSEMVGRKIRLTSDCETFKTEMMNIGVRKAREKMIIKIEERRIAIVKIHVLINIKVRKDWNVG